MRAEIVDDEVDRLRLLVASRDPSKRSGESPAGSVRCRVSLAPAGERLSTTQKMFAVPRRTYS
jgi:hypothetical protein